MHLRAGSVPCARPWHFVWIQHSVPGTGVFSSWHPGFAEYVRKAVSLHHTQGPGTKLMVFMPRLSLCPVG